jgi:hypothetical protein
MIGIFPLALVAAILSAAATVTLRPGATQDTIRVGERMPELSGQTLTGRTTALPGASAGKVTLVAMGFTYASRYAVEAWAEWYRTTVDPAKNVTFFEVPMLGGAATLGRWFIDRGMRKGTPVELHDQVITVYGGTGDWKKRLAYPSSDKTRDDAYLIVLDREGVVRWLHHGAFDKSRSAELKDVLTTLDR